MGTQGLSINHPTPFDHVQAIPEKDAMGHDTGQCIVMASGTAHQGQRTKTPNLVACLVSQTDNAVQPSIILKWGLNWIILFKIPTPTDIVRYHLFVGRNDCGSNAGVSLEFYVKPPKDTFEPIPVTSPTIGANVCNPFFAYGPNGASGPAAACVMVGTNNGTFNGATVPDVPLGAWAFSFPFLPDDNYILTASNTGDGPGTVPGLTLDSATCQPVVAPDPPAPPPSPPPPPPPP
jgi:hypothetical protein